MLGRFHEISLSTPDIRASIDFYEALGFFQVPTLDVWPHRYGVLTDGRLILGLHENRERPPALSFVHPEVARHATELESSGYALTVRRTDPETFNEIALDDPEGQRLVLLEAPTHLPVTQRLESSSRCGDFAHLSLPARQPDAATRFWEAAGFVATPQLEEPYAHQPLTSDQLDLAWHSPRWLDAPALVFCDERMSTRIETLRAVTAARELPLPRALHSTGNALLAAPEGTHLLLLTGRL